MIRLKSILLNEKTYSQMQFLLGDLEFVTNVLRRVDRSDYEYMLKYLKKYYYQTYAASTPGESAAPHLEFFTWLENVLDSNKSRIINFGEDYQRCIDTVEGAKRWWTDYFNKKNNKG